MDEAHIRQLLEVRYNELRDASREMVYATHAMPLVQFDSQARQRWERAYEALRDVLKKQNAISYPYA